MNTEEKMKRVVDQLSEAGVSDSAMKKMLSDLAKLDKALDAVGDIGREPSLRLPYSSMPTLKSKCWK